MYSLQETIRPSADLRNHYNEISKQCREKNEAVIITVNGRGDTVYGAAASALIGYSNFILYWGSFTLILILAAAVHVISVKAIRKQSLADNKFVPLLPWFSILTTILYALLMTKT